MWEEQDKLSFDSDRSTLRRMCWIVFQKKRERREREKGDGYPEVLHLIVFLVTYLDQRDDSF